MGAEKISTSFEGRENPLEEVETIIQEVDYMLGDSEGGEFSMTDIFEAYAKLRYIRNELDSYGEDELGEQVDVLMSELYAVLVGDEEWEKYVKEIDEKNRDITLGNILDHKEQIEKMRKIRDEAIKAAFGREMQLVSLEDEHIDRITCKLNEMAETLSDRSPLTISKIEGLVGDPDPAEVVDVPVSDLIKLFKKITESTLANIMPLDAIKKRIAAEIMKVNEDLERVMALVMIGDMLLEKGLELPEGRLNQGLQDAIREIQNSQEKAKISSETREIVSSILTDLKEELLEFIR